MRFTVNYENTSNAHYRSRSFQRAREYRSGEAECSPIPALLWPRYPALRCHRCVDRYRPNLEKYLSTGSSHCYRAYFGLSRVRGRVKMSSSTSLSYAGAYGSFSTVPNGALSDRVPQSQTSGLDTLAEGSQYALEQLQLSREAHAKPKDQLYAESCNGFKASFQRDSLSEARSAIRKNSSSTPVRRRISRACDQCNQLRTKCDGHSPCAHCIGSDLIRSWSLRVLTLLQNLA